MIDWYMWKTKSVQTDDRNFQLRKEPHTPVLVCKESGTSGLHWTDVHNPLFPANQDMFLE